VAHRLTWRLPSACGTMPETECYVPPGKPAICSVNRAAIVKWAVLLLSMSIAAPVSGAAQRNRSLRARVFLPDGSPSQSIKIRLEGAEGEIIRDSFTDSTGNFEVRNLSSSTYTVVVPSDDRTYATATERVEITRYSPDVVAINVYLSPKEQGATRRKGESHTISAREATTSIPKPALRAYNRSVNLLKRGRTQQAIEELKRAIAIFPEYVKAYNDLGVAYIKLDRIEEAIRALEKSAALDPGAFNPRLNLGIANVRRQDFASAEPHLRLAAAIDASAPLAHLYLGITFWKTGRVDEAEDELLKALSLGGGDIAVAHYYLGQLYARRDRIADAIAELEAYLKDRPEAADAPRVREQIAELRPRQRR
jgi:Flp pilus assembly protein TadD